MFFTHSWHKKTTRTQALSKAKTELVSWREQHSRSETAERELRKRVEELQSNDREEKEELKRKLCEYEIDREQSKEDFDELWKELCRSKELVREMEAATTSNENSAEVKDEEQNEDDEQNENEEQKDALVVSTGAIDLLRELKGLASELENAKSNVDSNSSSSKDSSSSSNDVFTPPPVPVDDGTPPVPVDDGDDTFREDNDSEMLREALLRQETITSNVLNEFETNEALTQTLRRENESQLETNSRQKAALVALQISLKEEIELARSRSAFRDDSIVQRGSDGAFGISQEFTGG